jgi:nucleoside-diphosphate-sugar epimerase
MHILITGGGGFIGRVLRHQFAAEGFGQQRRGQAVDGGLSLGEAGFHAVGEGK